MTLAGILDIVDRRQSLLYNTLVATLAYARAYTRVYADIRWSTQ